MKKPSFSPVRTVVDYVSIITCMLLMSIVGAFIALGIR